MSNPQTRGEILGTAIRKKLVKFKSDKQTRQMVYIMVITLLLLPYKNIAMNLMFASRLFYTLSNAMRIIA